MNSATMELTEALAEKKAERLDQLDQLVRHLADGKPIDGSVFSVDDVESIVTGAGETPAGLQQRVALTARRNFLRTTIAAGDGADARVIEIDFQVRDAEAAFQATQAAHVQRVRELLQDREEAAGRVKAAKQSERELMSTQPAELRESQQTLSIEKETLAEKRRSLIKEIARATSDRDEHLAEIEGLKKSLKDTATRQRQCEFAVENLTNQISLRSEDLRKVNERLGAITQELSDIRVMALAA